MERYLYEFKGDLAPDTSILRLSGVQNYLKSIKKCEKKARDPSSLSYLIDRDLSQSACIRIGTVVEDILNIFLEYHLNNYYLRKNLKKNVKGERQKDILFIDEESKHVIYAEVKANINLDTQKLKATVESIQKVQNTYEEKGYSIQAYLITLRYLNTNDIPPSVVKKYQGVQLIGINDFMTDILRAEPLNELKSYESYSKFLDTVAGYIEAS